MPFSLFICGPRLEALADLATAMVEECAGRGLAAQVLSTRDYQAEGVFYVDSQALPARIAKLNAMPAAAIVLLPESRHQQREDLFGKIPDAVVVDWCRSGDADYQFSQRPHCAVHNEEDLVEGLAEVFALLEGLGYLDMAAQAQLSPAQDAELLEKLKDLGYV